MKLIDKILQHHRLCYFSTILASILTNVLTKANGSKLFLVVAVCCLLPVELIMNWRDHQAELKAIAENTKE